MQRLSYINLNDDLLEIAIDLKQERGRELLLVKHLETVAIFFQGAKSDHIKHLEDMSRVRGNVKIPTRALVRIAQISSET
jgi:hypothetical protein